MQQGWTEKESKNVLEKKIRKHFFPLDMIRSSHTLSDSLIFTLSPLSLSLSLPLSLSPSLPLTLSPSLPLSICAL